MRGYGQKANDDNPGMEMMNMVNMFGGAMQRGQQLEQGRMALEDEKGVNAAYEHIAGKVGQTGDISALDGDPIMNTRYGTMAAGKFLGQRAQNETSRLQMLKAMSASDDEFYTKTFRPMAFAAQEAFQKGDMQRFGAIANELSQKSPMPYHVQQAEDGNFTLMFRSNEHGGWVDTGQRMTPQEVMGSIGDIIGGEQKVMAGATMQTQVVNPRFLASAARYRMGTILSNAQAMEDPKRWIPMQKGGHTVWAIPQNRHDDYSTGPSYRIVDEGGKMNGMVDSLSQLMDAGYARADAKAKLENIQRRTGAGTEAGGKGGFALSESDRSFIDRASKYKDEDGNDAYDAEKGLALETLMSMGGLSRQGAMLAYTKNSEAAAGAILAKNPSLDRIEAQRMGEKLAQRTILERASGAGRPAQPQNGGGQRAPTSSGAPSQAMPPHAPNPQARLHDNIRRAVRGQE